MTRLRISYRSGATSLLFVLVAAAPFVVVACSKSEGASTSVSSATTPSVSVSVSASASVSAHDQPQTALSVTPSSYMSIPERFATEAMNRPTNMTVRVEETTAAFRKAGVEIIEEKQHLASSYLAKYCVGAKTKNDDISFSICEYESEAKAIEGAAMNDKAFASIKNRKTHRNGATTITLLENVKNEATDALLKKLLDTFMAMKPAAAPGSKAAAASASVPAASAAASK